MIDITVDIWSVLVLLGLIFLALAGSWTIVPRMQGMRYIPARHRWIRRALEMADVRPGEKIYDLGAGDGRVLIIASREFQARAVGVELEPVHCAVAWLKALFSGVITRVSVRCKDILKTDLNDADVVFMYLSPPLVEKLRPQLELQLRPGARVVSLSFPLEGWQPSDMDIGHLIFLYQMPPRPGDIDTFLQENMT